jgi:hypothetical protein
VTKEPEYSSDFGMGFCPKQWVFVIKWDYHVKGLKGSFWHCSQPLKQVGIRGSWLPIPNQSVGKRELKSLASSINYDSKGGSPCSGRAKFRFFMKSKILSWNVRGLRWLGRVRIQLQTNPQSNPQRKRRRVYD